MPVFDLLKARWRASIGRDGEDDVLAVGDGIKYCRKCAGMLGTERGTSELCSLRGYRHHDIRECWRSAGTGCELCRIIFHDGWERHNAVDAGEVMSSSSSPDASVSSSGASKTREKGKERYLHFFAQEVPPDIRKGEKKKPRKTKSHGPNLELKGTVRLVGGVFNETENGVQYWSTVIGLALLVAHDSPAADILPRRLFCEHFMTDYIMEGIADWLRDCMLSKKHDGCVYEGKPKLPTRVLDVREADRGTVRLHASAPDESEDYVALSYSWGGPQPLTALKENIDRLMTAGAACSELPQTLRDAVMTTKRLGISYLWVDAVCIIQDDDDDKGREINKMGALYRNATMTIVAAHSASASQGFLKPDFSRVQTPSVTVPLSTKGITRSGFGSIGGSANTAEVTLAVELAGQRAIQPLLTRGWALQEAMLSPRLATFSEFEVYCECNRKPSFRTLNAGPVERSQDASRYAPDRRLFSEFQDYQQQYGPRWMDGKYLAGVWEEMVFEFTRRDLTVADDRMAGIAGLASEMGLHLLDDGSTPGGYVAGTWAACLPQLLLWSRRDDAGATSRSWNRRDAGGNELPEQPRPQLARSARAPSWSWACLDCPVRFFSDEGDRHCAEVKLVDDLDEPLRRLLGWDKKGRDMSVLRVEGELLRRGRDQFQADKTSGNIKIVTDLEVDELAGGPAEKEDDDDEVCYLFLSKNVGPGEWDPELRPKGALRFWYASCIVLREVGRGSELFRRVAYLRWTPEEEVEEGHAFGERRSILLA